VNSYRTSYRARASARVRERAHVHGRGNRARGCKEGERDGTQVRKILAGVPPPSSASSTASSKGVPVNPRNTWRQRTICKTLHVSRRGEGRFKAACIQRNVSRVLFCPFHAPRDAGTLARAARVDGGARIAYAGRSNSTLWNPNGCLAAPYVVLSTCCNSGRETCNATDAVHSRDKRTAADLIRDARAIGIEEERNIATSITAYVSLISETWKY